MGVEATVEILGDISYTTIRRRCGKCDNFVRFSPLNFIILSLFLFIMLALAEIREVRLWQ